MRLPLLSRRGLQAALAAGVPADRVLDAALHHAPGTALTHSPGGDVAAMFQSMFDDPMTDDRGEAVLRELSAMAAEMAAHVQGRKCAARHPQDLLAGLRRERRERFCAVRAALVELCSSNSRSPASRSGPSLRCAAPA